MKKEKGDMLVKKHKNKKMKKKILRSLPIIILFCVYLCGYVYFSVHFLPKTIINGNRCGMKTVKEGNDLEKKRMRDYQIIMRLNNSECILMNKDVPYVRSDVRSEMKDILKKQKKFAWFLHLKDKKVFHIGKYVVNEDALKSSLNTFTFVHPEDIRQPENAKLKFNKKTQRYKIIEAVSGNKINFQKLISGVKKTAEAKKTYFDASKCYPQARVDSKSKQLLEAKKTLDAYLSCTIQYKSGTKNKKTLNANTIHEFLCWDKDFNVWINESLVKDYVEKELYHAFNTVGAKRTIHSPGSDKFTISGGTYGNQIDIEAETKEIIKDIKNSKMITREPKYFIKVTGSNNGIGKNYVDVNISKQKLWYIRKNKIVFSSDIVTGDPTTGHSTPTGMYYVEFKKTDYTMRKYNAHVNYWMPIDTGTGVGLHDASWRGSFGGEIYHGNGSHGCINMPTSKASVLYHMLPVNTPVIVH